eukprot:GHVN01002712.1.p1 GENE.GHVN01002712.1~~GHVN01002712.1.p1  ORF type:complete len:136 (-),score=8.35 GHVN01002712.1:240-647(-)
MSSSVEHRSGMLVKSSLSFTMSTERPMGKIDLVLYCFKPCLMEFLNSMKILEISLNRLLLPLLGWNDGSTTLISTSDPGVHVPVAADPSKTTGLPSRDDKKGTKLNQVEIDEIKDALSYIRPHLTSHTNQVSCLW